MERHYPFRQFLLVLFGVLITFIANAQATGSEAEPLTVTEFLEQGMPSVAVADTYVQGYIVGYVDGGVLSSGAHFNLTDGATVSNTNLLLAASSSETNVEMCIPVQLSSGTIRNALSLAQHPENLGHEIILCGSHEKYFGVNGLKSTSYYVWVGEAPMPRPLYICGNGDGLDWDAENPIEMSISEGNYVLWVNNLTAFKVSMAKGDWDTFNAATLGCIDYGEQPGVAVELIKGETSNIKCPWKGDYTITVSIDLKTITLTTTTPKPENELPKLYFRGSMNGWGADNAWEFEALSETQFKFVCSGDQIITTNDEFKIADSNWDKYNIGGYGSKIIIGTESPVASMEHSANLGISKNFYGTAWLNLDINGHAYLLLTNDKNTLPSWIAPEEIIYKGLSANADDWTLNVGKIPDGLNYVWGWDENYGLKGSAYCTTNYASDIWAVSPVIDLTNAEEATLKFSQAANYVNDHPEYLVTAVRVENGVWETLSVAPTPTGGNWTFVDSYASLNNYVGKKIQIGFNYKSTDTYAATWEIKNLIVEGKQKIDPVIPDDPQIPETSGVYFGITAFNHLPKIKQIQLLDERNKYDFFSFVNSQQMDDYTYLYYSVEQGINELKNQRYPEDLKNVTLITFTDGNDDGSLEMAPDWNDKMYQTHIKDLLSNSEVQGHKIGAYTIGLKGKEIQSPQLEDLFRSNLKALASEDKNAAEVENMNEVNRTLNKIIDDLQTTWLTKSLKYKINMRATGDIIRFTLDKSPEEMNYNPLNSDIWIQGVFSRSDLSLTNVEYHGLTSTSGNIVKAEQVTTNGKTKLQFNFMDLRDANGEPLSTGDINYWHSTQDEPELWIPHTQESSGADDVTTENKYTSAAIMFVMDCSSSLGENDFNELKYIANSLIERLATKKTVTVDVEKINIEYDPNAPEEYYNLQGIRINKPSRGIYIYRKGKTVKKVCL